MESLTISWVVNGLLAVVAYFLKLEHNSMKEDNKALWSELGVVKEKYYKKEDFLEFKRELWSRLDRMEEDFKHQIMELKK